MKHLARLAVIFAFASRVFAQAAPFITTNEFPSSDVVTVADHTKVSVAADGSFEALRRAKTKVLTAKGRRAAETMIPFNAAHQSVEFHFAKSVQPDGTERTLSTNQVQTVPLFPGHPAYRDVQVVRYVIPGAGVDALIDQEYLLRAKPLMKDHFWMIWRIRSGQPVVHTELNLRVPAQRKFEWRIHNAESKPDVVESADKKWKTYTWKHSATNELNSEPYMPPVDETLPWLEISTISSWEEVAAWLDKICTPQIDSSDDVQRRVQSLTAGLANDAEKIAAIYYWLEDNVRFVGVDLALSSYTPRAASQVYASRYGDAKDLSVLLAAMLQDAGVKARLAFLESGSARKISEFLPSPRRLTHCIVVAEAGGKQFYLDPTAETARYDVVLGRLCNTELLMIGEGANALVPSPAYDGKKHGTIERVKATLGADGSLKGEVQTEFFGESDAFIRAALKYTTSKQLQELMQQEVHKNLPEGTLLDYEVADVSQRDRNFVTSYRFESPAWAFVKDDKIRFKPQLLQDIKIPDHIFKAGKREFPFWFYESAPSRVEIDLALPEGYKVDWAPKDLSIDNLFSVWTRTIRKGDGRLLISEMSHLKTAKLPKEAIGLIREYYNQALDHKNEEVVLIKK